MELKSNEEKITRALLVSVDTGEYDAQASLDELFELVKSAGADPVLSVTQNLQKIEKGTFVGTGKLAEIARPRSPIRTTLILCRRSGRTA